MWSPPACKDTAPLPDCTTATLVDTATSATWLWADNLRPSPAAQARLGLLAESRRAQQPVLSPASAAARATIGWVNPARAASARDRIVVDEPAPARSPLRREPHRSQGAPHGHSASMASVAISAIVGAALLAACGGGDVRRAARPRAWSSFGDSLSDLGTYTPATQIPLGQALACRRSSAARFTTNTHTGYTASQQHQHRHDLGRVGRCARWAWRSRRPRSASAGAVGQVPGGDAQSRRWPAAAPATPRAVRASPIRSASATERQDGAAPMTVPMVTQVANHLARFGSFSGERHRASSSAATTTSSSSSARLGARPRCTPGRPRSAATCRHAPATELATW